MVDVGGNLVDLDAGDEPDQVVGVGADVAHHERRLAAHRVVAPRCRAIEVGATVARLAARYVFDLHELQAPEFAVGCHRPGNVW